VFTEQVKLDKVHGCRTQAEQLFDLLSDQGASVAEVDPRCVSDVSHATVEPYIVRPDGTSVGWRDDRVRVTGLSSFETQYGFETGTDASFDDVVVHVIRVDNVASLHIVSLRGEPNLSIRYRVDAANLKRLDDRLLWKTGQTLPGPTYSEETISFPTQTWKSASGTRIWICIRSRSPTPRKPGATRHGALQRSQSQLVRWNRS
jgi:hypothetical protein